LIEAELGVLLLDRDRRGVRLTEEGSLLLAEAYAVLGRFDRCVETMRRARVGARRVLVRVGMFSEFSRSRSPGMLAEIRRRDPDLMMAIEPMTSAAAVRGVEVGTIELGVVRSVPERSPVMRRLLASEKIGACLPADHPAAAGTVVEPGALAGEQLLWMPRVANPDYYDQVLSHLREVGLDVRTVESPGTAAASQALVASGYGWSLACRSEVTEPTLRWLPLAGLEIVAETWAVWSRDGAGAAVGRVVEILTDLLASIETTTRREKASF
jgi:DNA-binding transcriptional LysR family regulator